MQSAVYATETSTAEYLTTEESEKLEVERMAEARGGSMEQAIRILAAGKSGDRK